VRRIFLDRINGDYREVIRRGLQYIGVLDSIKASDRIAIKPNLTYPTFRKGVMTNPEAVEALLQVLSDHTSRLTIVESDSGGYNPFSMHEVFATTGLSDIGKRYGARIVNLTDQPSRDLPFRSAVRRLTVPLPLLLTDETDLFITVPVPKIHMNTKVSMSVKNQWGVIQSPAMRLKLHPYFVHAIYAVNKALPRSVSLIDGRYGLTRSGPMRGDVLDLNWLLAADDLFAADYVCCLLMGIQPSTVGYLRKIFAWEKISSTERMEFSQDWRPFVNDGFYLRRAWTDYPGLFTFKSRFLAYVGYESPLATVLHKLLYLFREPFY
jgi:uncharacterized protein (DUF362 family)